MANLRIRCVDSSFETSPVGLLLGATNLGDESFGSGSAVSEANDSFSAASLPSRQFHDVSDLGQTPSRAPTFFAVRPLRLHLATRATHCSAFFRDMPNLL